MDLSNIRIEVSTLMRFGSKMGWSVDAVFNNIASLTCTQLFELACMGDQSGTLTVDSLYEALDEDINLMSNLTTIITTQLSEKIKEQKKRVKK